MSSDNVFGADNQQAARKEISNEYFAGFTDGEGVSMWDLVNG